MWGPQVADVFTRVKYEPHHELDAAIAATGHKLEDVKKIIIGHLHLDHAGGLDLFLDRKDVEIWVHDLELRSAFWSVATGADVGVYLQHYLKLDLCVLGMFSAGLFAANLLIETGRLSMSEPWTLLSKSSSKSSKDVACPVRADRYAEGSLSIIFPAIPRASLACKSTCQKVAPSSSSQTTAM